MPGERGGFVVRSGRGEGVEDSFGRFSCSSVRGSKEVEGIRRAEERAELLACFFGLKR